MLNTQGLVRARSGGLLLLGLLAATTAARAQQPQQQQPGPISSGRPDQTTGTNVVARHFVQLESGLRYERGQTARTYDYPALTVRYGLFDQVELRLGTGLAASAPTNGQQAGHGGSSITPLELGTRVHLWDGKGWLPQAALTAVTTLPVGQKELRPSSPEVRLRLGLSNSLTDALSLTYTYGYGWVPNATEQEYAVSLTARVSKQFSVYGEAFGTTKSSARPDNEVDAGLLWLVRPNLQLDVAGGMGISRAAPVFFVTTGVAIRLPR